MNGEPHTDPKDTTPRAPRPPQQGKDIGPKLGRDQPGRGLDTGVDTGAIQPGASGDSAALD
jgi:hypothetical protein